MNQMILKFLSRSENENFARNAVAAFALSLNPTLSELSDVKTAVSEAVTNAIVHGYRNTRGMVEITLRMYSGNLLYISVKDKGSGIFDISRAMQPMFSTAPAEEERSGLGFTVMESFMDKVRVSSKPGKGTTVIMEKQLDKR